MKFKINNQNIEKADFHSFLKKLRQEDSVNWTQLISLLRRETQPLISAKLNKTDFNLIGKKEAYIEEILSASLINFYRSFKNHDFESLDNLKITFFKIVADQIKLSLKSFAQENYIFSNKANDHSALELEELTDIEKKRKTVQKIENQLAHLSKFDKDLVLRFSRGESIKKISKDLGLDIQRGKERVQEVMNSFRRKFVARALAR